MQTNNIPVQYIGTINRAQQEFEPLGKRKGELHHLKLNNELSPESNNLDSTELYPPLES